MPSPGQPPCGVAGDAALDLETVRTAVERDQVLVEASLRGHEGDGVGRDVGGVDDEHVDPAAQTHGQRGLYGAKHWLSPLWKRFAVGMLALAVGVTLFFFVTSLPILAAVMFVAGFAISPTLINGNNLVQLLVPPSQLTEGLTWVGTALGVGVSVGTSVAGARIDEAGSHAGFTVVVVAAGIAVLVMLASLTTLRSRTAGSTVTEGH